MAPIHLGFVGLSHKGWASSVLATPLFHTPLSSQYVVSAVSTTNPESASTVAQKYSELVGNTVKAYYGPTTAISGDPDIDMVAVSVKTPHHREVVMPVIEAGKDLFIEWPAGRNLKETVEIADAARQKGIKNMVGTQARQSLVFKKLKSIIESGEIGQIRSTTATARLSSSSFVWGPKVSAAAQYLAFAENGESFLNIGFGHFLDTLIFVLGPFKSVSAVLANHHPTAEIVDSEGKPTGQTIEQTCKNQAAVAGILQNGSVASLHWKAGIESDLGKGGTPFLWIIDGSEGSIRLENTSPDGFFPQLQDPKLFLNGEEVVIEEDGMTNTGRAWAEFAKGTDGDYPTLEDAVKTKRVLDAIERSAEEGRRIDL